MKTSRAIKFLLLAIFLTIAFGIVRTESQPAKIVLTVTVDGPITSSTAELVREAIDAANSRSGTAVVIQLNTPGGLVSATIDIIDKIERSSVPVVTYVSPQGARAWSAGAFILVGSHVAAMAPFTITGSSQPVSFDPLGGSQPINDTKTINALTSYIQERARLHGRNETAARDFVLRNLNLDEQSALRYGVIEFVAGSLSDLLGQMNGFEVETVAGTISLETTRVEVEEYSASIRLRVLDIISDPILASVAMLIGIYAVIFGLSAPGHTAEIIGAFLLIVGLVGLGLNVSIGALLLLLVGAILMIAEAYTPTHGALATAGLIFVVVGSLLLVPFETSRWIISPEWYSAFILTILLASSTIGAFTIFMVYKILRARMQKPVLHGMVGEKVEVVEDLEPGKFGYVKYSGEYWRARSNDTIKTGALAEVVRKDGPILVVRSIAT